MKKLKSSNNLFKLLLISVSLTNFKAIASDDEHEKKGSKLISINYKKYDPSIPTKDEEELLHLFTTQSKITTTPPRKTLPSNPSLSAPGNLENKGKSPSELLFSRFQDTTETNYYFPKKAVIKFNNSDLHNYKDFYESQNYNHLTDMDTFLLKGGWSYNHLFMSIYTLVYDKIRIKNDILNPPYMLKRMGEIKIFIIFM